MATYKLCDFCSATPSEIRLFAAGWQVVCRCGARGPRGTTYEDAARRWNTRSISAAEATLREANGEAESC